MTEPSKVLKKRLWRLNGLAYRRELAVELEKISQKLGEWKKGKIEIFDVVQAIHEFHDGTARELYKFYVLLRNPQATVIRALETGVLAQSEFSKEAWAFLESIIVVNRKVGKRGRK